MTEEQAGAWTRTSRVIRARPEELYAAFLDPTALIDWLPPEEMTGEIHEFDARVPCPWLGAHRIMMASLRRPPQRRAASAGHVRGCCPPAPRPLRTRRAPPRSGRACGVGRLARSAVGDSP
jgi:hypothetical protein